ncbi:MAG: helix-turn-helix domain-containing protein [Agitococcus sp.]|jgi:transcriptional regulator with XRE-family HTH domain|nr:helix-turn-helix domain-containing protein [Agitococcus sp.]
MNFDFATEPEIRAELGKRLANIRIARGLSQAQLAAKAAIGVATLQRFEQGEGATLSNFIRLMMALGKVEDLNILLQSKILTIDALEQQHALKGRKRVSRKYT